MTQAKEKTNSVVTSEWDAGGNVLTIRVLGAKPLTLTFDRRKADAELQARAERHGWLQRIMDAAAKEKDKATGKSASPEVKAASMKRLIDHYESGSPSWSPARAEPVVRVKEVAVLDPLAIAAVGEATGRDEESVRALIAKGAAARGVAEATYLAVLTRSEKVAPILERMREEAANDIDADDELAEWEDEDGDN